LPQGGRIETPLRRFGSGRMAADPDAGKACLTEYDVLDRRPETTLLRVRPLTGRKHQIRAHLFGIGHPIVGDPLYGDKRFQRSFARLMLHASSIRLTLPAGGELQVESPAAAGFMALSLMRRSVA
jgi:23S rRNA-/tRNA-specific pseudouridylate synthase